jgi:amidase
MVPAGIGGDGGGSIRIPSASCGLFGLKPQRGRVSTAPQPHLWYALGTSGPLTRTVRDSAVIYDVIRGNVPGDLYAAEGSDSFVEAVDREPGRLRIGWSVKPVTLGIRVDPVQARAVEDTARLLADLGHDVRRVEPRYPDPSPAFVTQFFAGIRAEAELVEHRDRLERRTRQTCRLGWWTTPRVIDWAMTQSERVAAKANRVFDDIDVLLTPVIAHRPPRVGRLDGIGTTRGALRSMPFITFTALGNVAGNPAASVPRGIAADGLPLSVQVVGRRHDEATIFSLSAQIEQADPWPRLAPVNRPGTVGPGA